MNKTYADCVREAKKLIEGIEVKEAAIAKIVLEVCEIKKGGNIRARENSLTEFAKDICLNRSTLYRWVRVYKEICLENDIYDPDQKEWRTANKAWRKITEEKATENSHGKKKNVPYKHDKQVAIDTFQSFASGEENEVFTTIHKEVLRLKARVKRLDLVIATDSMLLSTMSALDEMSDQINDYLTKKRKLQKRAG